MARAGRPRKAAAISLPQVSILRSSKDEENAAQEKSRRTEDFQKSLEARRRRHGFLSDAAAASPRFHGVEGLMSAELLLDGKRRPPLITERQREACRMFRRAYHRYRRECGGPRGPTGTLQAYLPEAPSRETSNQAVARHAYDRALAALGTAGRSAAVAVQMLVERDAEPPREALPDLRRGLDALVAHYGVDRVEEA